MPSVGLNRNIQSTPAIAGATAYGQISSVLYTAAPRTTRSANTASSRRDDEAEPATQHREDGRDPNELR